MKFFLFLGRVLKALLIMFIGFCICTLILEFGRQGFIGKGFENFVIKFDDFVPSAVTNIRNFFTGVKEGIINFAKSIIAK